MDLPPTPDSLQMAPKAPQLLTPLFPPQTHCFHTSAFGALCLDSPSFMGRLDNSYTPFKALLKHPLLSILVCSESVAPSTPGPILLSTLCLFPHCIITVSSARCPPTGPHLQVSPSPQLVCEFRPPHVSPRPCATSSQVSLPQSGPPAHHDSVALVLRSAKSLLCSKAFHSSPLP